MLKKRLKIAILAVILIIAIVVVVLMITNKEKKYEEEHRDTSEIEEMATIYNSEITRTEYRAVKACVTKYLSILDIENSGYYARGENGQAVSIVDDKERKENIIELLSDKFIRENSITVENLEQYVKLEKEILTFIPTDVKRLKDESKKAYVVKGITTDLNFQFHDEMTLIVYIDYINKTFIIEPIKEDYEKIDKIEEVPNIKEGKNNLYDTMDVNVENTISEYFDIYKELALAKPEIAYEKLDKEYREKKFGTLENFKKYIEKNHDKIFTLRLKRYLVNNYDDYTQYVGQDVNGKDYIFNEKSAVDYSMILDTYTIDLPRFTEKYNKANDEQKVGYNVERFISAINDGDYRFAYNLLDEEYKKNNIPTQEEFEAYVKNNMYENNKVEHGEIDKQGNNFIHEIKLKDANDEQSQEKSMTIIMQLKEGSDFVMSFSMN